MNEKSSSQSRSRRQIVFDWLSDDRGYWGGATEVAEVDALLAALDAVASEKPATYPRVEAPGEFNTIYVTFRETRDGDTAKVVQRTVPASCDYDAAGNLIGVEIFDVLPEPK